jgi:hypothetical protein
MLLQKGLLIARDPSEDPWRVARLLHQVVDLEINRDIRLAASVLEGGPGGVRQAEALVDGRDADIAKSHVLRIDAAIVFESLMHYLLQMLVILTDKDASRRRSDESGSV